MFLLCLLHKVEINLKVLCKPSGRREGFSSVLVSLWVGLCPRTLPHTEQLGPPAEHPAPTLVMITATFGSTGQWPI